MFSVTCAQRWVGSDDEAWILDFFRLLGSPIGRSQSEAFRKVKFRNAKTADSQESKKQS